MKMTVGMIGAVVMAAFGTYYFQNKKRNRKRALLCKALATAVPGVLLVLSLGGILTGDLKAAAYPAGRAAAPWPDGR